MFWRFFYEFDNCKPVIGCHKGRTTHRCCHFGYYELVESGISKLYPASTFTLCYEGCRMYIWVWRYEMKLWKGIHGGIFCHDCRNSIIVDDYELYQILEKWVSMPTILIGVLEYTMFQNSLRKRRNLRWTDRKCLSALQPIQIGFNFLLVLGNFLNLLLMREAASLRK